MADLKVGDRVFAQFGPYRAVATVIEIKDAGAVLQLDETATLVGFEYPLRAPNGNHLTEDVMHSFIGRAHWPSVERVQ